MWRSDNLEINYCHVFNIMSSEVYALHSFFFKKESKKALQQHIFNAALLWNIMSIIYPYLKLCNYLLFFSSLCFGQTQICLHQLVYSESTHMWKLVDNSRGYLPCIMEFMWHLALHSVLTGFLRNLEVLLLTGRVERAWTFPPGMTLQ